MKKQTVDIFTSVILLIISISGFLLAGNINPPDDTEVYGPAFFPKLVLVILGFLSVILLVKGIITYKKKADKLGLDKKSLCVILGFIMLLIAYIYLFFLLGFMISTILFLIAAQLIFGLKKKITLIVVSILVPVILFYVFTVLFKIPLP